MALGNQNYTMQAQISIGDCLENSTTIISLMTKPRIEIIA